MTRKKTPIQMVKMADARRRAVRDLFFIEGKITSSAETFLADLKEFCRGGTNQSTFVRNDPNGREQALLEGRREVWNRICLYIGLTDEDIQYLREHIPS